mgnify:CR=1 FL=1|tara:strand:+ start:10608 stop:11240 length:633 start_codon:yes stop_codon:yes gene_type:complete
MNNKNIYMYNKRLKLLKFAKVKVAEIGLNTNTLRDISLEHNLDINEVELLFPNGNSDLIKFILEELNINLENNCKKIDLIRLPIHKRIKRILLSKIDILEKEKKFYKKIFLNLLIPNKNISLPRQLYKSIDQIWFLAGDSSVDFNFYTKRLILSAIYTRTILFFFNNDNRKELENILDKNLKRVSKIPKIKSSIKILFKNLPNIFKFVKN